MDDAAIDELVGIIGKWFPMVRDKVGAAKLLLRLNPALGQELDAWGRRHYGKAE